MINSGVTLHLDPHKFSAYGGPRVCPSTKSIPPDSLLLGTVLLFFLLLCGVLRLKKRIQASGERGRETAIMGHYTVSF